MPGIDSTVGTIFPPCSAHVPLPGHRPAKLKEPLCTNNLTTSTESDSHEPTIVSALAAAD